MYFMRQAEGAREVEQGRALDRLCDALEHQSSPNTSLFYVPARFDLFPGMDAVSLLDLRLSVPRRRSRPIIASFRPAFSGNDAGVVRSWVGSPPSCLASILPPSAAHLSLSRRSWS
jgi:hypothetical protein